MWGFGGHSSGPTQGTTQRILLANPDYTQRYLELSRSRSGSAQQTPHTGRMNASPLTRSTANTQHTHHHHHTHHQHHSTVEGTSAIPTSARQKLSNGHEEDTMAATHSAILSAPLSQTESAMDFTNSRRWSPRRHAVPRSPWAVNAEPASTTTTTTGMSSARPLCAPTTCPSLNLRTQHYAYPSASTSATQSVFASSMHVSSSANGTMPGSSGKSSEGTSSRSNVSHTVRIPRAATATTNNNKGSAAQTIVIARQGTSAASPRRQDPQRHNNDMNDNNEDDESGGKQHAAYCHGSKHSSPCEIRGHALTIPTGADVAATTTGGGTVTTGSTGPYFTMSSNNTTEATTISSAASTHELSNCKVITPRSHKDVMTTPGTTNTTTTNTVSGAAATWPSSSFLQSSSPTFLTVGSGSVTGHEAETSHTVHPATTVQHEKQEEETTTRVANTGKAQELPSERYYHAPYSRVNSMTVTSGLTLAAGAPGRGAEVRCGKAAQMVRAVVSARGGFETTTITNNTNSSAGLTSEPTRAKTNTIQSAGDGRYAAVPSSTTTSSTTIEALVSARYGRAAVVRPRNGGGPILYSPPTTNNMSTTMEVRGRNGSALISPAPPPAPATLYTTGSSNNSSGRRVGALRLRTSSAATRRSNNNMNSNGGAYDRRGGGEGGVGGETRNEVRSARSLQALAKSRDVLRRLVEQWNYVAEENKEAYKEGGYLAVTPGDVLHGRYIVVQKLGWGQFSTVWLCYDKLSDSTEGKNGSSAPAFVAIKIARCDRNAQHRATTVYEVRLLRYLSLLLPPACPVTSLLDSFEVNGAYGTHLCMVMPVHGSNLLCVVDAMKAAGLRRRSAQEVRLIKHILLAVLDGLEGLRAGYVLHTDIKPENILCTSPDPKTVSFMQAFCRRQSLQGKVNSGSCDEMMLAAMNGRGGGGAWRELVCLADMGLSVVLEPPSVTGAAMAIAGQARTSLSHLVGQKKEFHVRRRGVVSNTNGVLIQTREYRAPEVLLGMDFTCETDVWSVGCVAYELITGQFLMDPKRKTRNARQMDIEHLAMMMQLIGPLPSEITELRQKFTAYYDGRDLSSIDLHAARTPPVYLHRYVDRDGNFIYANMYRHYERRQLYKELEPYLGSTDEAMEAASFILMCLYSYEPQYRPTAAELKAHSWLQDAAK